MRPTKKVFTDAQLDAFIIHLVEKYPDALANIFRYWDELHHSNNSKLLARILHQSRMSTKDFPARSDIFSEGERSYLEFHRAVIDRIRHLRQTGEIVGPRNYPPAASHIKGQSLP